MYKNSSAPLNNTALWHYLGTKHLDFRHENNRTPGGINQGNTVIVIISSALYGVANVQTNY